ncbi:hypothetical protein DMENIID0001_165840 [Sergentomyia squamirostris]
MPTDLDIFSLNQRIFMVKHFYQAWGDYVIVKKKYEKYYDGEDDPDFSNYALIEVMNLFEKTGTVLKETAGEYLDVESLCELCGQVFTGIQSFQMHQLTHTNETQFKCNVKNCQKTFQQRASYKAHQATHANSEGTSSKAAASGS